MRTHARRLGSGALTYGLGGVIQRFLGIFLLPFYTRALSLADYGTISLISLLTIALGGLFTLGTGNSISLLYYREADLTKRPSIIWSNAILLTVNGVILVSVLMLLSPLLSKVVFESPDQAVLLRIALISLLVTTVMEPFYTYLRMEERAKTFVLLTLIDSVVTIAITTYMVLFLRMEVVGMLLAALASRIFMFAVVAVVVARKVKFGFNFRLSIPLVRIGFPVVFGMFAFMLIDYADRQLLQRMLGMEQLGIYSVGYNFGLVVLIAVGAFGSVWPPFFMSFINKPDEARVVFGHVLTYYCLFFGLMIVLFFAAARPVVLLFTAPTFHGAYRVVGLVAAAYVLKGCYLILLPGIYFAEKLHLQTLIEWSAAIVNIGANLLLIPLLGIAGSALATLASYFCLCLLSWAISQRFLKVKYEWTRIALIAFSVTAACSAIMAANRSGSIVYESLTSATVLTLFLLLTFFVLVNSRERQFVLEKVRATVSRLRWRVA